MEIRGICNNFGRQRKDRNMMSKNDVDKASCIVTACLIEISEVKHAFI